MTPVFDMLGITCADMAQSIAFYRLLGWDFPEAEDGGSYTEIKLPSGLRISLNAESMVREIDPNWVKPVGHRMGVAFLCGSPAEVNAKYAQITEAGHQGHAEPWDAFWGQRYSQVCDPDGNIIDLFSPL